MTDLQQKIRFCYLEPTFVFKGIVVLNCVCLCVSARQLAERSRRPGVHADGAHATAEPLARPEGVLPAVRQGQGRGLVPDVRRRRDAGAGGAEESGGRSGQYVVPAARVHHAQEDRCGRHVHNQSIVLFRL